MIGTKSELDRFEIVEDSKRGSDVATEKNDTATSHRQKAWLSRDNSLMTTWQSFTVY